MRQWTEIFDFDLFFLLLEDLDVSRNLADLLDNSANILKYEIWKFETWKCIILALILLTRRA